jgi:hypothetical protein
MLKVEIIAKLKVVFVYVWEVGGKKSNPNFIMQFALNFCVNLPTLFQENNGGCIQHEQLQFLIFKMCLHHPRVGYKDYNCDYLVIMHYKL